MRDIIIKVCSWLLTAMGLGAISGCNGLPFIPKSEYGTPHCSYEVKCRVVDSEKGSPVKGVKLTPGLKYTATDEAGNKVEQFYPMTEGEISDEGYFEMAGKKYDGEYDELHIRMTDPDPEKDGHYKDSIYVVDLTKIREADKKDHWSAGTYGADVTLKAEEMK